MMKKYISSERANLFEPNVYITMAVTVEGSVDADAAVNAVKTAYCANEAAMSEVVLEQNGEAYYEKMQSSGCAAAVDSRDMLTIIRESEKRAFDLRNGELIRTFVVPNDGGITFLVHAHHLAGDGKSILILINDMLSALSGKVPEYKPMLLINREYLNRCAKLPAAVRFYVKSINRKWQKNGQNFGWEHYYEVHRKYWECHTSDFEISYYSLDELNERRTEGATINSLLITEILKEHPECRVTGIPISIRESDNGMSNQTSGVALKYRYDKSKSFECNLRRVHKGIYKLVNNANARYFVLMFMSELCPSLVDGVLLQTHGCIDSAAVAKTAVTLGYIGDNSRDIGVTNLGRLDIMQNCGSFRVTDFLFVPPKVSYAKEVVGAAGLGDKLTVCSHVMNE